MTWFLNTDGSISDDALGEITTSLLPPGALIYAATNNLGEDWLLCDGSQVSRTTYANLFSAIGTRYGIGDGSTTFGLPDLRGRSLLGAGLGTAGGTLTDRDINVKYLGEEQHTMTEEELVAHTHVWSGPDRRNAGRGSSDNICWTGTKDDDTESTGGSMPFNVMHPCLIAYGFIKT